MTSSTETPLTAGRHVSVWPVTNAHIMPLQRIVTEPGPRLYWRTRGVYWSPQNLQYQLNQGVLQAAVGTLGHGIDDDVLGLAELLDPHFVDQRAQLSVVTDPAFSGSGTAVEFTLLFVRWAFDTYPLNKLYLEVNAANQRLAPGLGRVLTLEGTLRHHVNINGTWYDIDIYGLYRNQIDALWERFTPRWQHQPRP